eukprot:CAMPEP_0206408550 /NCGR_PEP_ID=MMETSP0294-20121207/31242_1 /ASSEMBLY_ACC=CAM_ASM_000327 /TAXON_ID=39354 /ORGANISM="Heterosigma akashiwo, Strain CCMP2393" /LENGTH=294 /DNA_ID=CAMNT_0053868083 /DNA_START=417 /DNA_END=1301 /DNA_ORIENTATION=-
MSNDDLHPAGGKGRRGGGSSPSAQPQHPPHELVHHEEQRVGRHPVHQAWAGPLEERAVPLVLGDARGQRGQPRVLPRGGEVHPRLDHVHGVGQPGADPAGEAAGQRVQQPVVPLGHARAQVVLELFVDQQRDHRVGHVAQDLDAHAPVAEEGARATLAQHRLQRLARGGVHAGLQPGLDGLVGHAQARGQGVAQAGRGQDAQGLGQAPALEGVAEVLVAAKVGCHTGYRAHHHDRQPRPQAGPATPGEDHLGRLQGADLCGGILLDCLHCVERLEGRLDHSCGHPTGNCIFQSI